MGWRHRAFTLYIVLGAVCVMTILGSFRAYAQVSPVPASETQAVESPDGSLVGVGEPVTTIIPSLRLAERYDSNVLFSPGGNFEDYVTTVSPQVRMTHRNQWGEGLIGGGATGEVYANNPGLNYVGGNGIVDLNLERAMNALVRGLGLRISDSISYTPQPPAFAAPTGGNQLSETLVQGLQARRANSITNQARVEASYFFSPDMGVTSTYSDTRIRFGTGFSTPTGVVPSGEFINTNYQTLTSGLVGRPSLTDTISLSHQYRKATFAQPDREDRGFSTQGVMSRWTRAITPSIDAMIEGGFSVVSRGNGVYPVGGGSLEWRGQSTAVMVSYSRGIAPSFLFIATAMSSQVVTGSVTHQVAEDLSLSVSGNYALNQSIPDSSLTRFESYSVTPALQYKIGQNLRATLSYARNGFQRTFVGQSLDFNRHVVMLNFLYEWR